MRQAEEKAKETDDSLKQAFSDLNSLIEKSKDMVKLAEKLQQIQEKEKSKGEQSDELRSILISIGIASPVTKESAGSLYHDALARQLSDWLQKPLEKSGGVIALTDLYCLFNRARGTEMISPDDLYRAALLFETLKLPVRLRKFESGVLAVQSLSHTDTEVVKTVSTLIKTHGPQSSFDYARVKNISLALAQDNLETAEKLGAVCRDETYEGTTFYLNYFEDMKLIKMSVK